MCNPVLDLAALIRAFRRNDRQAADRAFTRLTGCGFRLMRGSDLPPRSKPGALEN